MGKKNNMTEFDYLSKKLPSLAKTVDKARRKKIIEFIKNKTGKKPIITSKHRSKFHKHKSINHELYGAVDIAGDKNSEMLMNAIGEIKGRAIDERKAKSETLPNRNVVHFDLKTGKGKALDKMLMKMQGRKLKGGYDAPGTIRTETRQGTYPKRGKFKKATIKKKLDNKKTSTDGYNISQEQMDKIKKESKNYMEFQNALQKYLEGEQNGN